MPPTRRHRHAPQRDWGFSEGVERGRWRCEDFSNPNEAAIATWLQTYAPDGPGQVVAVGGGGGDGRQTLCAFPARGE